MTPSLQAVIPASISQRLPCDLLGYLFGFILLSDPSKGAMRVSHICQWWRQVALDTSFIWRNITIRLCTSSESQKHFLALAHFERSRNFPITLTIHAIRPFKPWERTDLILPYAYRLRSLRIETSAGQGSLASLLWSELNTIMPRLEAFDSVILDTSRVSINRKIANAVDGTFKIIPSISIRNLIRWDSWSPTGLTALTLDTICLSNKPDLDDIYNALAASCHTIQHFEYVGLIACIDVGLDIRTRLVFPALRSLSVLSHDDMVPLLQFMIIPALDSLILRDFIACPHIPTIPASELMDTDELTPGLTFDPDGLFRIIEEWNTITHLQIYGIDDLPDDMLSPPPDPINYIKSLKQLSSLVLYGDGVATSFAHALLMHDPAEEPLLPQLSHFLLAINDMADLDLFRYFLTRNRHRLPRLQKLSVNWKYIQCLIESNRMNILWEGSDDIFSITDPEYGRHVPMEEEIYLRHS